ncbi:MAG: CAP domain-containing protein, partial [Planctomycetota bacterium]
AAAARLARQAVASGAPAGFAGFWRLTCRQAVLVENRCREGLQPQEQWALRELNLYRMSLDEQPVTICTALQAAAHKHGLAMRQKKYFGHFDPDPSLRTPLLRAQAEGYDGAIGEAVTGGQDGVRSLWRWRSDAGHHRVLVYPTWCVGGFAEVDGKETFDAGDQPDGPLAALFAAPGGAAGRDSTVIARADLRADPRALPQALLQP